MTETQNPVVSQEASEQYRAGFIEEFEGHDTLTEEEHNIHEIEAGEIHLPDDYTLQRIVASYEEVQVWLLNDFGPLQAFYVEDEAWGKSGDCEDVAREIEERLLS